LNLVYFIDKNSPQRRLQMRLL